MNDPFAFDHHFVLITGGGSGIGRAIASCFVSRGAHVVVTGRREAPLRETVKRVGGAAVARVHDVSDLDSIPDFVAELERDVGPIGTVVNNAGINQKLPSLEVTDAQFDEVLATNLKGAVAMSRACAQRMVQRKWGDIQMITSMAAFFGLEQVAACTASKSALQGLVHQLAVEWGRSGVRVDGVAPGFIVTEMGRTALDSDPRAPREGP
ncbi:MAG: SDR family oxidoreductase [Trueperaceae bacterium]|nr:SDR family oxidoreductase [Trueperaceae bacterium]